MASFENEAAVKSVVLANTKFAFNLYKELVGCCEQDGNFAVSPFALSTALAAVYRGANEQTAAQIKQAMKLDLFDLDDYTIHAAFAELVDLTLNKSPNCNFTMLNGLFTQEGFPLEEDFAESMSKQYQVKAQSLDFGEDPEASCDAIRQWVEDSTAAQVRDIIHEVSGDTLMAIINLAIYKGQWQRKFDSKSKRDFQMPTGETMKVSFMGASAEFNHAVLEDLDAEAIAIPYQNHDVSLIIVLPNSADGLATTEKAMTGDAIEEVISNMSKQRIKVEIPKFRLNFRQDMEQVLRQLDINDLFTLGEADLSGVDGTEALYVSRFMHRTIVEIGEEGDAPGQAAGGGGEVVREFIANHPFLYFIHDNRTESILLMGRYNNPPPKFSDDGLGARMGMSVKNAFKRMSSKEPAPAATPGTPTSPKRQDSSSSLPGKKQAPPPPSSPPAPKPQAQAITTAPGTASYGATEQKAEVNPPQSPTSASKKKQKSHSSLFFCCVKGSADDLDFDSM